MCFSISCCLLWIVFNCCVCCLQFVTPNLTYWVPEQITWVHLSIQIYLTLSTTVHWHQFHWITHYKMFRRFPWSWTKLLICLAYGLVFGLGQIVCRSWINLDCVPQFSQLGSLYGVDYPAVKIIKLWSLEDLELRNIKKLEAFKSDSYSKLVEIYSEEISCENPFCEDCN